MNELPDSMQRVRSERRKLRVDDYFAICTTNILQNLQDGEPTSCDEHLSYSGSHTPEVCPTHQAKVVDLELATMIMHSPPSLPNLPLVSAITMQSFALLVLSENARDGKAEGQNFESF